MNVVDLLVTLNKLPPQAWDAVIPHSHRQWVIENRLERVGINPQPLPPVEIAISAAISVAQDLVRAGSIAESIGHGGSSLIAQEIEDWCGTTPPRLAPDSDASKSRPMVTGYDTAMPTPHDPTEIPDRLMADPELAAPEIDDADGGMVTEDPAEPDLPAP